MYLRLLQGKYLVGAMGVSAVFALDLKGKVIIARDYRGDVALNCTERFTQHLADVENEVRCVFCDLQTICMMATILYNEQERGLHLSDSQIPNVGKEH